MEDCIFCKIAQGSIPSKTIYEDEDIKVIHDINPVAPVHALIMPKAHIACVDEIDGGNSAVIARIFEKIPKIAKTLDVSGSYRIINNCGVGAGQTVFHLHFHLISGCSRMSEKLV